MRAARSVFESAITLLDVVADTDADSRYMKHLGVSAFIEASMSLGEELLSDAEREREVDRRERYMAAAKPTYDELMQDPAYGRRFRNSWSKSDLASRARAHGHGDMYLLYKFASGITHAGAGGSYGVEQLILEHQVIRTGPALAVCPIAALYSIRSLRLVLPLPFRSDDHPYAIALLEALDAAEAAWPQFRREVLALDEATWPLEPPPQGFEAVVAISAYGVRWFIGDSRRRELAEIPPPVDEPEVVGRLMEAVREEIGGGDEEAFFILSGVIPVMPPQPKWVAFEDVSSSGMMMQIEVP
jgi:hypothetical protein